jgi:hypothetical protein
MKRVELSIELGSQWSATFDRRRELVGVELADEGEYTLLSDVVLRIQVGSEPVLCVPLSFLQMWRLAKPVEIPPRTPLQIAIRAYSAQIPGEYVRIAILLTDSSDVRPSDR